MMYIKVKWNHSFSDYPVFLYSELDVERWEMRKVEVFPDGRMGYAPPDFAVRDTGTGLSEVPMPPLEEVAADPEFEPTTISAAEFEEVWAKATAG